MIRRARIEYRFNPDHPPTTTELGDILTTAADQFATDNGGHLEDVESVDTATDPDTGEIIAGITAVIRTGLILP